MNLKQPAVILTLAVAIGSNTAVFSVIHSVMMKPLPYPEADRLAVLWTDDPVHNVRTEGVSYPNFADWREMNQTFDAMAVFIRTPATQVNVGTAGVPQRVQAGMVSADFFRVLGVNPAMGGTFSTEEERVSNTVVVSAGIGAALGEKLIIDGAPHTVIGVMPPEFHFPTGDTRLWLPYTKLVPYQYPGRAADPFVVLGRMKRGVSAAQAQADMDRVGQRLKMAHPKMPDDFGGFGVNVIPLFEHAYGTTMRPALLLLFGAVVAVLLVACANVANLLLARAEARKREFALRAALGAGWRDLARQVLTEAVGLSLAAALAAIGLAYASLRSLQAWTGGDFWWLQRVRLEWPVLLFTAGVSLAVTLVCSMAPLVSALRRDPAEVLQQGGRSTESPRTKAFKRGLVIAEIALASMLVSAGGLLARSFVNVQQVKLGYKPEQLLVMELVNRRHGFANAAERGRHGARVRDELVARVKAMPGVQDVALVGELFPERNPDWQIALADKGPSAEGENRGKLGDDLVSANYFELMGTRLVEGRTFTREEENDPRRLAAIVNQRMARTWWPGQSAVGKRFSIDSAGPGRQWRTVVGVVEDMRVSGREAEPVAQMFWATADYPDTKIVVRLDGDPAPLIGFAKAEIRRIDSDALIHKTTTVERQLDEALANRKLQTSLIAIFAMLTLLLAAVGVAALLHYSVSRRVKEFGIRTAMGATPADLLRLVSGEGLRMAALGSAVGLLGTVWVNRALVSFLYGVPPGDFWATAAPTAIILIAVSLIASALPAWRGARVDPLVSLRHD